MPALLCSPFLSVASSTLPCSAHTEVSCESHWNRACTMQSHVAEGRTLAADRSRSAHLVVLQQHALVNRDLRVLLPGLLQGCKGLPIQNVHLRKQTFQSGCLSMVACSEECLIRQLCSAECMSCMTTVQHATVGVSNRKAPSATAGAPAAVHLQQINRVAVIA
jgi:hypothetical protein